LPEQRREWMRGSDLKSADKIYIDNHNM